MTRKYYIGLAVVIVLLALFCSQGKKENKTKETEANAAIKKEALASKAEVTVALVKLGPIFKAYSAMGTIASKDMARIMPKVIGRIAKIYVSEGDRVWAGKLLMQISPAEYHWVYQNAAALARTAGVAMEKSQRDFDRAESLHKESAISDQNYQDARSAYEATRYQYEQAKAGEAIAQKSLQECNVIAPISGVVTFKFGNEGELTGPQSPYPIFIIEQMGAVKLEVDLPEDAFGYLAVGNKTIITVDAIPNQTFEGTITKIYPTINPLSKTFKVSIALANPEMKLRSGMTARAKVIQKARDSIIYAPKTALISGEEGYFVYKVDGSIVRKTKVMVGIEGDDKMEISSGLKAGNWVVVEGLTGLKDGMDVKVTSQDRLDMAQPLSTPKKLAQGPMQIGPTPSTPAAATKEK
jgi:RND family efflux transporter MFP subunit